MMMEQDAKRVDKPRNPGRNQEMMMEQDGKRVGRQAPEPHPEPRKDDGTGCQTSRETRRVGRQAQEP